MSAPIHLMKLTVTEAPQVRNRNESGIDWLHVASVTLCKYTENKNFLRIMPLARRAPSEKNVKL